MSFEAIVGSYIRHHRDRVRAEMCLFKRQSSLVEAIRNAVRPGGQKHPHQYRIPLAVLDEAERRLNAATADLVRAQDFDTLHRLVDSTIRQPIPGIGPLVVYDVAHRLGAFLGKTPTLVYLHSGAAAGAAALGFRGEAIHPDMLPAAFSLLSAAEIEDCLCRYKAMLRGGEIGSVPMQRSNRCKSTTFPRGRKC